MPHPEKVKIEKSEKSEVSPGKMEQATNLSEEAEELAKQGYKEKNEQKIQKAREMLAKAREILEGKEKEEFSEKEIEDIVGKMEYAFGKEENHWGPSTMPQIIQQEVLPQISEIPSKSLERVVNQFIERYKDKKYYSYGLMVFISSLINRTTAEYTKKEKQKGLEEKKIKNLILHINTKPLKEIVGFGYENQDKCHLIIDGDGGSSLGQKMKGGIIEANENVKDYVGTHMQGGLIEIKGNAEQRVAQDMQGGQITIKGDVGSYFAEDMKGGKLIIEGDAEFDGQNALYSTNQGEIWHKGEKIWPK